MNNDSTLVEFEVRSLNSGDSSPLDSAALLAFMARATIALDGLWFGSVVREIGRERALELDKAAFAALFKVATRIWREVSGCDTSTANGRAEIFRAISYLFHHDARITSNESASTMSISRCGVFEALKAAGLTGQHDCRQVCQYIAPRWFAEIDASMAQNAAVDLKIPTGGPSCDWVMKRSTE